MSAKQVSLAEWLRRLIRISNEEFFCYSLLSSTLVVRRFESYSWRIFFAWWGIQRKFWFILEDWLCTFFCVFIRRFRSFINALQYPKDIFCWSHHIRMTAYLNCSLRPVHNLHETKKFTQNILTVWLQIPPPHQTSYLAACLIQGT